MSEEMRERRMLYLRPQPVTAQRRVVRAERLAEHFVEAAGGGREVKGGRMEGRSVKKGVE